MKKTGKVKDRKRKAKTGLNASVSSKKRQRFVATSNGQNEEITSESDISDSEAPAAAAAVADERLDSDSEAETAQEARVRLAKRYIAELKEQERERLLEVGEPADDDEAEEELAGGLAVAKQNQLVGAVSSRLQAENLAKAGQLQRTVASAIQPVDKHQLLVARNGHKLSVTCARLGHGGQFLVTGGKDGAICVWSLKQQQQQQLHIARSQRILGGVRQRKGSSHVSRHSAVHSAHVLCLCVSSDDTRLASGDADGLVLVWAVAPAPNAQFSLQRLHAFTGHRAAITALAFRHGPQHQLFSASRDKTLRHWGLGDTADTGCGFMEALFGHSHHVTDVDSFSLERCLSSGADRTLRLWKIPEESQLVFELDSEAGSCECVAMVSERQFISGQTNGSLSLWSVQKKRPVCTVPSAHGPDRWVTAVAAVKNCDLAASGSWDGAVRLWRVDNNKLLPLFTIEAVGFVNSLSFDANATQLAIGVGQEHKWGRWWRQAQARNCCYVAKLKI